MAPRRSVPGSAELAEVDRAIGRIAIGSPRPKRGIAAPRLHRILLAIDPSSNWEVVAAWAEEFCRTSKCRLSAVSVLNPDRVLREVADAYDDLPLNQIKKNEEDEANKVLDRVQARLGRLAKGKIERILRRGHPTEEITDAASKVKADLVILGSHGHGKWERVLLGSVADGVKNRVGCHALIARGPVQRGPILVPVDGSDRSRRAVHWALRIGEAWNQPVHVLHVFGFNILRYVEIGEDEFRDILRKHRLPKASERVKYVLDFGSPGSQIVKYVQTNRPGLLVMGSRGLGMISSAVLGGVSNRVSHEAPVSCLFVKG